MTSLPLAQQRLRDRNLLFLTTPMLWPTWPFLPLVRRLPGQDEPECGVLYDARGASGTYGYSASVFRANVFLLPRNEAQILALPHYTYDTVEEILAAGWTVD